MMLGRGLNPSSGKLFIRSIHPPCPCSNVSNDRMVGSGLNRLMTGSYGRTGPADESPRDEPAGRDEAAVSRPVALLTLEGFAIA